MMNVKTTKGYDIKFSYSFDVSDYIRRQKNCGKTIIAFVRVITKRGILLEELFGSKRSMWFPLSHIRLTPQTECNFLKFEEKRSED